MRIGIVTFSRAVNYGAMLQAYAMQTYLQHRGHQVEFIDCVFEKKSNPQRIIISRRFPFLILRPFALRNRSVVLEFGKRFTFTREYTSVEDLRQDPPGCDVYLVGSDQMWNWNYFPMDDWLTVTFLDVFETQARRISYAVSFGCRLTKELQERVSPWLERFEAISVREDVGVEWVKEICGKPSHWHCDPTLLFDGTFYLDSLECRVTNKARERFIFAFFLEGGNVAHFEGHLLPILKKRGIGADKLSQTYQWKSWLGLFMDVRRRKPVERWVDEISKASFVLTDSFHGTIFAVIFKRPFIATLRNQQGYEDMECRVISLLGRLGLSERLVNIETSEKDLERLVDTPINWDMAHERLAAWRKETDNYFQGLGL